MPRPAITTTTLPGILGKGITPRLLCLSTRVYLSHHPLLPRHFQAYNPSLCLPYLDSPTRRSFSSSPSHRNPSRYTRGRTNRAIVIFTAALATLVTVQLSSKIPALQGAMPSKLVPTNPEEVMVIRDVTPNVVTLSVPFARFGKVPIGGRATIVRLTSGALAIFSPVALTLTVRAKLSSLGNNVRYLIAPDIEHHLFLSEWKSAFPDAKLIGPEGLPEKRAKAHAAGSEMIGNEEFDAIVTRENYLNVLGEFGEDFATDFDMEYVSAHPNRELVFYFRPDRVLIQADLFFNLPATEQYSRVPESEKPSPGLLTRMFTSLQTPGSGNPLGMKRFMWYLVSNSRGDREAFNESVRRIGEWDFEVVVPCHGETVVQGGKELFERVFEWHLKAAREKGKF